MIEAVKNVKSTLRTPLIIFTISALWIPNNVDGLKKTLLNVYRFVLFTIILGINTTAEAIEIFMVWGNMSLTMSSMFLLFTNLSCITKVLNCILRKKEIQAMIDEVEEELGAVSGEEEKKIVDSGNRVTSIQMNIYFGFSVMSILSLTITPDEGHLPFRGWYPYDTTKAPGLQLTSAFQCFVVALSAAINISLDILVSTLIYQCHSRLQLSALKLITLCDGVPFNIQGFHSTYDEETVINRLHQCIKQHQAALKQARLLQTYFFVPIFFQFSVSMITICVSAYLIAMESNFGNIVSMGSYLLAMMLQLLLYCYNGNKLLHESGNVKDAAYQSQWYKCSVRVRRELLMLMARTYRPTRLRAGGITDLSLASFMSIIKASYSFYTVLQQVDEEN
ncbi:unnamed protein product [Parnassius apollo]|uniref:Odorant receptor n=1 Tax=Parnassius apollo TaxID=110799 RepID=A0A8S3XSJ7_PARAO|nr:unnamed protein product [Parnassius apollo]